MSMSVESSTRQDQNLDQGLEPGVIAGVDTHQRTHHAAVIDRTGRLLGEREFPASRAGYRELIAWVGGHGPVAAVGVESTGSYGAGLAMALLVAGIEVFEVDRPEKSTRARRGKSDAIDAESAARQVLAGSATGRPKIKTGIVESIRAVKIPRDGAVKDRTRAYSQLRDLATTAPDELREALLGLSGKARVKKAAAYRPDLSRLGDPTQATKRALKTLANRIRALDTEIAEADKVLAALTAQAVPTLLAMPQVGVQSAARLAITAGQNIDRMHSEPAFAKLCGVAPVPASSGKTTRMRLSRGGDRQANSALHMVIIGRLKDHQPTRDYRDRRASEHKDDADTIRCLKRYLARSTYQALRNDLISP